MLPNLGAPEILIVLAILALLFGAKRIPDLARSVGGGIREFRKVSRFNEDDRPDEKRQTELTAAKSEKDENSEPVIGSSGAVIRETR